MTFSFDSDIAIRVGVNAAILYNNIQWWCLTHKANNDERYFHDGKWWMTNSRSAWVKLYPFFTDKSIRTALYKLVEEGLITKGEFNDSALDKTNWYSAPLSELSVRENALALSGQSIGQKRPISRARNINILTDNIDVLTNNVINKNKEKNYIRKESAAQIGNQDNTPFDAAAYVHTQWGETMMRQFNLTNKLLLKAICTAYAYCISNEIEWNEQSMKKHTFNELKFHTAEYKQKSEFEFVNAKGERYFDWGDSRYIIPEDAPPRPNRESRYDKDTAEWVPFFNHNDD